MMRETRDRGSTTVRRRRPGLLVIFIIFLILSACGFTFITYFPIREFTRDPDSPTITEVGEVFKKAGAALEDESDTDWMLELVNPWNPMAQGYTPPLSEVEDGYMFDSRAADALKNMLGDARNEGLNPTIISAYRDVEYQEMLYNKKVSYYLGFGYSQEGAENEAATIVARPGTSEHSLGLAADITSAVYTSLTVGQEQTAEYQWLEENCWRYGFIVRYPSGKTEITGIIYEPWHFRYVGDAAEDIYASGLCFEEWLETQ